VEIHQRLHREWPALARQYRQALPDIVSPEQWAKTFDAWSPGSAGVPGDAPDRPDRREQETP
jgi:galactofuranosylgalactofuranosylrhamnosyl-N-acetylglucosaminyl-diphospho-decaprenol beta-1,5/1,6-galactofuranosyltransferase